jgi:hypothetical protein
LSKRLEPTIAAFGTKNRDLCHELLWRMVDKQFVDRAQVQFTDAIVAPLNRRVVMNIRALACSVFALAILAPAAGAATFFQHKHQMEPSHREHVHKDNHWFDLNSRSNTCVTVNGIEVTHRRSLDCLTTDMPYYDAYAPDGFAADNYIPNGLAADNNGPTGESHRHH